MDIKRMTSISLMAALCCVLGPFSIPIGPVPVSLSTIAVFLCVFALGRKDGTVAVAVYILLGTVGLPVFSGFVGGIAKILGPTGGYIVGYLFLAWIAGWFIDRYPKEKAYLYVGGMLFGEVVLYVFGTAWFMFEMQVGLKEALGMCVIPFIPFDVVKILLSVVIGTVLRSALMRAGLRSNMR